MYLALSLVTGLLIALMVQANGLLRGLVGQWPTLAVIHGVGLIASILYFLGKKILKKKGGSARTEDSSGRFPLWGFAAGLLGIGVVFINNEVFTRGGVLLTLSATLAGQTLSASILELSSLFKERQAPALQRILSPLLIVPGAVLIALKSGISLGWGILAVMPGVLLMIQGVMNSRLITLLDTPKMLMLNYGTATAALTVIILLTEGFSAAFPAERWKDIPFYLLFAGGLLGMTVVAASSFLFTRTSLVKVVLGLYIGQIGLGLILDLIAGRGIVVEKIIGILLLVLGLLSGKIPVKTENGG